MIVKMKKITLFVQRDNRKSLIENLKDLGVLHINVLKSKATEESKAIYNTLEKTEKVLRILQSDSLKGKQEKNKKTDYEKLVDDILMLVQKKESLQKQLEELQQKKQWFENWGNISYSSLKILESAGIFIRFYSLPVKQIKNIGKDQMIYSIKKEKGVACIALFSFSSENKLEYKEEPVPEVEYRDLVQQIDTDIASINSIDQQILQLAHYKDGMIHIIRELQKKYTFHTVLNSMQHFEEISIIEGYCPVDNIPEIKRLSDKNKYAYIIKEPEDPSEVPTLIKTPKWVSLIKPLFQFMGTIPGYDEIDISAVFLLFFSLFYAMLIGDAGYGILLVFMTLLIKKINKKTPKEFVRLMLVLSFSTIIWGLITGTWFGSKYINKLPILSIFVIDHLDSFKNESQFFVMQLSFIIGAIHLSIARILSAFNKINSFAAIAEIAWIGVIWFLYFLSEFLVLRHTLPEWTILLIIICFIFIVLFENFQKNILKGVLQTLSDLPLRIISSFADLVSYIRLFAVGIATVIVAVSFNDLAFRFGLNNITSSIITVLILIVGHSLNIVLALVSVLVHGVRLNMLEFSNHVGLQWKGYSYKPFGVEERNH